MEKQKELSVLAWIESFGSLNTCQVFMISPDSYREISALEPMLPFFEGKFNGYELPVPDVIILFLRGTFLFVV